jgi:hypothetical protein
MADRLADDAERRFWTVGPPSKRRRTQISEQATDITVCDLSIYYSLAPAHLT